MKALVLLLALAGGVSAFKEAVLYLTGASCFEELDSQTVERYEALSANPLNLNSAPRSRLLSSGLFSPFQVASLIDFRSRTGDILSFAELSLLDGFSVEFTDALKLFVCLESTGPPGKRKDLSWTHDMDVRSKYDGSDFTYAGRYSVSASDCFQACVTSTGTFNMTYHSRSLPLKFLIGDFNARFGQGLSMWSGMTMSGFPTVSSFRKNACGFSAAQGYSTEYHRGACFEIGFDRWNVSAGISFPGLGNIMRGKSDAVSYLPMASVSYTGKILSLSFLAHSYFSPGASSHALSADFRLGLKCLSLFGESVCNYVAGTGVFAPAVSAGLIWSPTYTGRYSVLARYYSPSYSNSFASPPSSSSRHSDEAGFSAGMSLEWLSITADFSFRPSDRDWFMKSVCSVSRQFTLWHSLILTPSLRVLLRYKPSESDRIKYDLRADMSANLSDWTVCARYNTVLFTSRSWIWYMEAGWKKTFLRFTLFKVDDWSDRIYAYERSAPGNFSVPSFYGRGFKLSVYSAWKIARIHGIYFSASYISYPWNLVQKDARMVLQIQYSLSLHSRKKSPKFAESEKVRPNEYSKDIHSRSAPD